ncbi:MAG TPA: hypothetical protein DIS59_01450, partial [Candidatus Magasanikbacteria bacterium]|nr:hypothetical protein [Candidatus Magasanikbacteria bacterium]
DVNESFKNFAMTSKAGEPGKIRFGLTAIKNVGEHICDMIYRERKEHGQYTSLENFLERVTDKDLNKKSLESLIQAGALDCFHQDRGVLLANIENILFYSKHQKEQGVTNQGSLFAGTTISLDDSVVLKDAPVATMDDKLLWEKTLLGIYVSSHPFAKYEHLFRNALTAMSDIEHVQRDEWVITGGVIDAAQKKITKKGGVMMFVTIQDNTGSMEYLVFPKTFEKTKDMWVVGNVVVVVGKTPREEGDNKIFVENVYLLTPENAASVAGQVSLGTHVERAAKKEAEKYVTIPVSKEQLKNSAGALKELFAAHPGDARVYFEVEGQSVRTETFVHEGEALEQAISGLLEIR